MTEKQVSGGSPMSQNSEKYTIEVLAIAAVDEPAFINSHFALVNDIVLASEQRT